MPADRRLTNDPEAQGGVGGDYIICKAAATLLIGDVVMISTDNTVNKSAVAANGAFFAGVVIGGGGDYGTDEPLGWDVAYVGLQAALVNKSVLVQVNGIANVKAGAVIVAGNRMGFDTGTAGRVIPNAVAGQIIGISMTGAAGGAGNNFRLLIQPR